MNHATVAKLAAMRLEACYAIERATKENLVIHWFDPGQVPWVRGDRARRLQQVATRMCMRFSMTWNKTDWTPRVGPRPSDGPLAQNRLETKGLEHPCCSALANTLWTDGADPTARPTGRADLAREPCGRERTDQTERTDPRLERIW